MMAIVAGETECGQKGELEILAHVVVGQTLEGPLDVQLQQAAPTPCKLLFACCLGGGCRFYREAEAGDTRAVAESSMT